MACGGSPLKPAAVSSAPAAKVERVGDLTIVCDEVVCDFVGTLTNTGAGCATWVSGVTEFLVFGERRARFSVPSVGPAAVRRGESAVFTGTFARKLLVAILSTEWYSRTSFQWTNGGC